MSSLSLKILTPEGSPFEGPVEAVFLPGVKGRFEVLPGHAPIISALEAGSVVWRLPGGKEDTLSVSGGAAMLDRNTVTVCVQVG